MTDKTIVGLIIVSTILFVVVLLKLTLRKPTPEEEEAQKLKQTQTHIHVSDIISISWHVLVPALGAFIGFLKLLYNIWRRSPDGSPERFWTGLALALIAGLLAFLIIKIIDLVVNRSSRPKLDNEEAEALGYITNRKYQVFVAGRDISGLLDQLNRKSDISDNNGGLH